MRDALTGFLDSLSCASGCRVFADDSEDIPNYVVAHQVLDSNFLRDQESPGVEPLVKNNASKSQFGRTESDQRRFDFSHEEDGFAWISDLIVRLFPRVEHYLQSVVEDVINPTIDSQLPDMLQGKIKLENVKIGEASPKIGPISIRSREKDDETIVIDMGIDLDAEMEITIKVTRFHIGLKALLIHGMLTIALRPKALKPPFFGGVEMYFVNPPDVDAVFSGAADFANIPGIRGMIRKAINAAVADALVIPARIGQDLIENDDTDLADLRFPDPFGILQITLLSGKRLVAKDDSWFRKNVVSDPYVVVRLGSDSWTSPIIKRTVNPVWKKNNVAQLALYDTRQNLDFIVWDEDKLSQDDLMGKSDKVLAQKTYQAGKRCHFELPLKLKGEDAGSLAITTDWFVLSTGKPVKPHTLYFTFKISRVNGLPMGSHGPFRVALQIGKDIKLKSSPNKPLDPMALAPIGGALQGVVQRMHAHGIAPKVIANCTELREEHVHYILTYERDPKAAAKHLLQASKDRQNQMPLFDEILRKLIPWKEANASNPIDIVVLDSSGKKVASSPSFPLSSVLNASGMERLGPFKSGAVEVEGSIRCRWLVQS